MKKYQTLLLATILGSLEACSPAAPGSSAAPAAAGPPAQDAGARIYSGNCVACHQQDARGIPGVFPSLVGSPVVLGDPKALSRWVVKGERAASMPAGRHTAEMPQFGWMNAAEIAALLTYLRSHFGNAAPPVEAATLADALRE